jgi:hypothetical protein
MGFFGALFKEVVSQVGPSKKMPWLYNKTGRAELERIAGYTDPQTRKLILEHAAGLGTSQDSVAETARKLKEKYGPKTKDRFMQAAEARYSSK